MKYTKEQLKEIINIKDWRDRIEAARQGYGLDKLIIDEDSYIRITAVNKLREFAKQGKIKVEIKNDYKYTPKTKDELSELIDDLSVSLGDIDVSNIADMSWLFFKCKRTNFDGIENWDVSNVKDMSNMFEWSNFNGDISNWNVSNVKDMSYMFAWSKFNGDISNWDTSNVVDMDSMFYKSNFNGDISKWNLKSLERSVDDIGYKKLNNKKKVK